MDIKFSPKEIKVEIFITPHEAKELLDYLNKRIEPSPAAKKLISVLHTISQMQGII